MQITERIDTAMTGGILNILGFIFQNVWFWPASMYFGLTGGLIAANFNPFIAILTATGPLAPDRKQRSDDKNTTSYEVFYDENGVYCSNIYSASPFDSLVVCI